MDMRPRNMAATVRVTAMARIAGSHHVLGIKHLLCELGHSESTVLLGATAGQGSEARHEEMKTWERYHVDSQFPQISIQLTGESQTSCDARHCTRYQMVKITVCRGG